MVLIISQLHGADRLKISLTLAKYPIDEIPDNFIELLTIKDGEILSKNDKPDYNKIKDEFARRTYDESGNYIVSGMGVVVKEHLNDGSNFGYLTSNSGGNSSQLVAGVEAGKAYVLGYEYENLVTRYIPFEKGIDYKDVEQQTVTSNYANYVLVNECIGFGDIDSDVKVSLYSTAQTKISNLGYSSSSPSGSVTGTARIKAIEYDSGTIGSPSCVYRVYLYDITMTSGSFANVKSLYYNNSAKADFYADTVLESGISVIKDSNYDIGIFPFATKNTKRIRDINGAIDTTYSYMKSFDVTIATNGTFSIDTGSDYDNFYSTGVLNTSQKRQNFILNLNAAVLTSNLTGTITVASGNSNVTGTSTTFTTDLVVGEKISINSSSEKYIVSAIANNTSLTLSSNVTTTATSSAFKKWFGEGDIIDLGSRTVNVSTNRLANFDISETLASTVSATAIVKLNKIDAREKRKLIRKNRYVLLDLNTHSNGITGPWGLGLSDVSKIVSVRKASTFSNVTDGVDITSSFIFDNGQQDSMYDHAKLLKSSSLTLTTADKLLVKLDYFEHDLSQGVGYFSIDSYPIDDVNTSNTSAITTKEVTMYRSGTTGEIYDLRDCIDIRPSKINTATDTTSLVSISTNPATTDTFKKTADSLFMSYPNENFVMDMSYYLPRIDLVILDSEGSYRVIRGNPSNNPITPIEPENSIVLANIFVAPYPSLSMQTSTLYNRPNYAVKVTTIDNKRFTMRDIGALKKRIENIEYYTSLSLLEKDTLGIKVLDSNGLDRFKNGILVDPFLGTGVANVFDSDFAASIDSKLGELRPKADITNIPLDISSVSNITRKSNDGILTVSSGTSFVESEWVYQGTNFAGATAKGYIRYKVGNKLYIEQISGTFVNATNVKGNTSLATSSLTSHKLIDSGNLLTLPYIHNKKISQPFSTTTRNAAGLMWLWRGEVSMLPPSDFWVDTINAPDVRINIDGNLDAWQNTQDSWGTNWGSWQTNWTGSQVVATTNKATSSTYFAGPIEFNGGNGFQAIYQNFETTTSVRDTGISTRTGTKFTSIPQSQEYSIGNRIVDSSIVPYMRSIEVKFAGHGFKPRR